MSNVHEVREGVKCAALSAIDFLATNDCLDELTDILVDLSMHIHTMQKGLNDDTPKPIEFRNLPVNRFGDN